MELQNWWTQVQWLCILSIPVACISWTVTHEEVFREPREFCIRWSKKGRSLFTRKFFYMFTCEYCFSHYVTVLILLLSQFRLLFSDWRGYVISGFSIVWVANLYMAIFSLLRYGIKKEQIDISVKEEQLKNNDQSRG